MRIKQTLLGLSAIVGLLTVNLAAPDAQAQQRGQLCDARTTVLTELNGSAGDLDGLATWNRILRAIEELRAGKRPEGEKLH